MLHQLSQQKINLLAFTIVPAGIEYTQLVLFPENIGDLARVAEKSDFVLDGRKKAFLIQGDDRLGALTEIHRKLCDHHINVFASSGVSDGSGGYGYILHVKPDDFNDAARVLGV
ncbi:MAG: hypothetical protein ABIA59_02750 [Candidatus Latescibacterota bacterium]